MKKAQRDPSLQDRTLEISLLGGMATLKLGHRDDPGTVHLIESRSDDIKQLEAPRTGQLHELEKLNHQRGIFTAEKKHNLIAVLFGIV